MHCKPVDTVQASRRWNAETPAGRLLASCCLASRPAPRSSGKR